MPTDVLEETVLGSIRPTSFQTIKQDVLHKIRAGIWKSGAYIPGEQELSEKYGCSRTTVNRALRELADSGVLERRRKAGTKVSSTSVQAARLWIPIVRQEIEDRGQDYGYKLLEKTIEPAPAAISKILSIEETTDVICVKCLHYADDIPYQLEERWLNPAAVPEAKDQSFDEMGPNEWLVMTQPVADMEHVFTASNATKEQAGLLDIKEKDALFVIERRTWSEHHTITVVRFFSPGARYKMVSQV